MDCVWPWCCDAGGSIGLRAGAVRGGVDGAQRADMIEYDIDEVA